MSAEPVTRESFARLVLDLRAELAEVTEARRRQFFTVPRRGVPKSWEAYPWARDYAGIAEVMELTGLARNSVRLFDSQARMARERGEVTATYNFGGEPHPRRLMPPSVSTGKHRKWMLGELALWMAIREDRQAVNQAAGPDPQHITRIREIHARGDGVTVKGISAELGVDPGLAAHLIAEAGLKSAAPSANYATDHQLLDAAREAVKRHGPGVPAGVIGEQIRAAGLRAAPRRIGPALVRARAEHVRAAMEPSTGSHGAELESMRPDGLVTATQIAAAFGCGQGAVTHAVERHQLTPVLWEPFGGDQRPLFDPARLAVRRDGQKGPVDADSPLAADMNLTGKEQK